MVYIYGILQRFTGQKLMFLILSNNNHKKRLISKDYFYNTLIFIILGYNALNIYFI